MSDDFLIRMQLRSLQRDRRRMALTAELAALAREAEDDAHAIRRYREVMEIEGQEGAKAESSTLPIFRPVIFQSESIVAARQNDRAGLSRKDMVLAILQSAHPEGLNAKQIRGKAAANYRVELNPNTLTVTLGRYREDGVVRSVGRTWYFLTENERNERKLLNGRTKQVEGNA